MSRKILESNNDTLQNFEKHKLLIVKDYKTRSRHSIFGILTFISGIIMCIVLSNTNQIGLAVFILFVSFAMGTLLLLLGKRCVVCDGFFSKDSVSDETSNKTISFCRNCKLTDEQMNRYVDMLARNVEINEVAVRKIFLDE